MRNKLELNKHDEKVQYRQGLPDIPEVQKISDRDPSQYLHNHFNFRTQFASVVFIEMSSQVQGIKLLL